MKSTPNLKTMQTFDEKNLPSVSVAVLGALELFATEGLPKTKFPKYKKPVVLGSVNAEITSQILYANEDVIFANENNYKDSIKKKPDGAIIFSASGEKHALEMAKFFKSKNLPTTLVTCNENSSTGKILGDKNTIVTKKNREPYTYNTSTYLGWILAKTKEDPKKIHDFIKKNLKGKITKKIAQSKGFVFILPSEHEKIEEMVDTKFVELFARRIAKEILTFEKLKHARTVVPYNKEYFIQFGNEAKLNLPKGRSSVIPLPKNSDSGTLLAITYYIVGKIQEQNPQWFKKNINEYIAQANKTKFGKGLKVIVE